MNADQRKRCAIYTRVSRPYGQQTDSQESELRDFATRRGWSVRRVYEDKGISGATESRPALNQLMQDCRQRKIDVVAVWKFDRFARSVKQLVTSLAEFQALGIDFVSSTEAIDTSLPMGQLVFHVLGAVAQLERSIIAERTVAGLREARRKGKRLGRPPAPELRLNQVECIRKERAAGKLSLRQLAKRHALPLWRVHRLCRANPARVDKTNNCATPKTAI
jgi:DNA invertase Pin-like site-specific DNA recombinase